MNNNGKGRIVLIILIPIFLILALIITDTLISFIENKRFKNITEDIIIETMNRDDLYYDEYYDNIKRLYERNNFDTDMLLVEASDYEVYVENENNYFGLFTSLRNHTYKMGEIKILGVTFKVKKNSKSFIKVTAKNDRGYIEFFYTK